MKTTIKTGNAVWAQVSYFNGQPVKCQTFVQIKRKRKYAYLTICRGDMEISGDGVAWIGNEPSRTAHRVKLAELGSKLETIIQGY